MTTKQLQQTIQDVISPIVQTYKPEKIILFGSAVTGTMHEDSDLDFVIIKKTKQRFYDRIGKVLHILYAPTRSLGVPVDVLVYTPEEFSQMSQERYFIRDEVVDKGRIVYDKSAS